MKKIYTLVGLLLIAGSSFSQSINGQYEFKAVEKHSANAITTIDGRSNAINQDRVTYYSENFDAMSVLDGSAGWTAAIQGGNVGFQLTNVGPANTAGSSFTIPALQSSTPTQWVMLDSDSEGQSGSDEDATLTSDVIDLTVGGTVTVGTALKIEFEQFFAEWEQAPNYDTLYVGVSDDNGATWNEVQISNGVGREGRPNPEVVAVNITPFAINPANIQIRFRWDGNWAYGWQIDNVTVQDLPPNDMKIVEVFRADVRNNYMYSRVPQNQATEFVLGVVAQNVGYLDQTNIGFNWTLTDPGATASNGSSSTSIPSLAYGEFDTLWVSTGITPTMLGNYTIDFDVTQTETDDVPSNNSLTDANFELTQDIYGADYGTVKTAFYNWAGNTGAEASIGVNFSIINDGVIGAIDAELDDDSRVVDQLIKYTIYKYDFTNQQYNYIDETNEYLTEVTDQGTFVRILFNNTIDVVAGDLILACAGHLGGDPSAGFVMAGAVPAGEVAGYNESSTANDLISSLADPAAAAVRLVMIDFTTVEENIESNGISIYPNPANSEINIKLTPSDSENTMVNITDVTGKVIKTVKITNTTETQTISIELDELSNGVYFVEVITDNSREVKKFIKK